MVVSVFITGIKTAASSTPEKTKLFSRHWYIAREEDYSNNFGEEVDSMLFTSAAAVFTMQEYSFKINC